MQFFQIYSYKYDINISALIKRRLQLANAKFSIICESRNSISLEIADSSFDSFVNSVCDVLLFDLSSLELADMIRPLQLSIEQKREILINATEYAHKAALKIPVRKSLVTYFYENERLVLEGFIMFRMKDTHEIWERCVEKAIDESIVFIEQYEFAQFLLELISSMPDDLPNIKGLNNFASAGETIVMIRKDGSCTIVDDNNCHIDFPCDANESVMNILLTINPQKIMIYDMAGDSNNELISTLEGIFVGRVRVYRTV